MDYYVTITIMNETPSVAQPLRTKLRVQRQFMQLIGTNIRTFDANDQLICFAKAKAFKLREEITFYKDETKTTPLFTAKARNIIDFSPTFDMFDPSGVLFGSLKREGMMSTFAQDHWFILDKDGQQIGDIIEDSLMLGVIRRHIELVAYFIPQTYSVKFGAVEVAEITQRKNPFLVKYDYEIDTEVWQKNELLCLAISSLLAVVEARQN